MLFPRSPSRDPKALFFSASLTPHLAQLTGLIGPNKAMRTLGLAGARQIQDSTTRHRGSRTVTASEDSDCEHEEAILSLTDTWYPAG